MPQDLEKSVICIYNQLGNIVGTGFFVTDTMAVTCAHVINSAQAGPGGLVNARYCQDAPDKKYLALVMAEYWSPAEKDDIAFLKFNVQPAGSEPAWLGHSRQSGGHPYAAFGFPKGDIAEGRWARDVIGGHLEKQGGGKLLQLRGDEIEHGMSGAPVLDVQINRVVGMVARGKDTQHAQLAYAIPAETLQWYCRELRLDDQRLFDILQKHFPEKLLANPDQLDAVLEDYAAHVEKLYEWKELHNFFDRTVQLYDQYEREIQHARRDPAASTRAIRNSWYPISEWLTSMVVWASEKMRLIDERLVISADGTVMRGPRWALKIEDLRKSIHNHLELGKKQEDEARNAGIFRRIRTSRLLDENWFDELEELSSNLRSLALQNMHVADSQLRETATHLYDISKETFRGKA